MNFLEFHIEDPQLEARIHYAEIYDNISSSSSSPNGSNSKVSINSFSLSLTGRPYGSSLLVNPLVGIQCAHRTEERKFLLVVQNCFADNEFVLPSLAVPEFLVRFNFMVCEIRGKWQESFCIVGYCFHDFFKSTHIYHQVSGDAAIL